jgi:hypothetical protein
MNLASVAAATKVTTPAEPVYVGLRVSTDREFSAPRFATDVRPLAAEGLTSALVEARELLAKGAFNGTDDPAKAVVLLATDTPVGPDGEPPVTKFSAGALAENSRGEFHASGFPKADANFEYWYEPVAVAVLDADHFELTH